MNTADSFAPKFNTLLFLPWEFDMLGGVDVVVDRLWHGLEREKPGTALIGIQDWIRSGYITDAAGRRFLHLNMPAPTDLSTLSSLTYLATLARRLPSLKKQLDRAGIGTVNVHFPTLNTYPLALLKRMGVWRGRMALSFHGSDVSSIDASASAWRLIAAETDAVTACSQALANRIEATGLFHRSRVTVIHNGIDCSHFTSLAITQDERFPKPYLLNVGNYIPRKGQDVLLAAFSQIAERFAEITLICVGGTDNGEWLGGLIAQAEDLGISERVRFLENQSQSQVATLMRNAACLVHTAHEEPFGLVIIEAGAFGLPVVATRVGGIPEIIASGNQGLLVPPGDPDTLASSIAIVLTAPDEAVAMGQKLYDRVAEQFSIEVMITRYRETLATCDNKL